MRKVKVLLVSGNYELSSALKKIVTEDRRLMLVAQAQDAYGARDAIIEYEPDVMLLCNNLPRMEGIVFLRKLMPQYPLPTVVIAMTNLEEAAYEAGAADFVGFNEEQANPYSVLTYEMLGERLIRALYPSWNGEEEKAIQQKKGNPSDFVIAIGASTGGTDAIVEVVRHLRPDVPGVVAVIHMPEGFTNLYAQRLDEESVVSVREAKSGDVVRNGQVLLAPAGDKHMRLVKVNGIYQVECRKGPKVSGHCPSVDALFDSVARVAGRNSLGVILTGMGRDGAEGLLAMRKAGAMTIGQDEQSCVVYGMPKAAYDIGAVVRQAPLGQIAHKIHYFLDKK